MIRRAARAVRAGVLYPVAVVYLRWLTPRRLHRWVPAEQRRHLYAVVEAHERLWRGVVDDWQRRERVFGRRPRP